MWVEMDHRGWCWTPGAELAPALEHPSPHARMGLVLMGHRPTTALSPMTADLGPPAAQAGRGPRAVAVALLRT